MTGRGDLHPRRTPDLDDEALATRVQAGCAASFEALVCRYENRLLRFLVQRTGHVQDAEDLLQETFLRAHRQIQSYKPAWKLATWLFTIASRLAVSHGRRPRRVVAEAGHTAEADQREPGAIVSEREEIENLWATAARLLSGPQYTALWLRYAEGMSIREIARVMDKTRTNVKVLLFRGRSALAHQLDGRDPSAGSVGPTWPARARPVPPVAVGDG